MHRFRLMGFTLLTVVMLPILATAQPIPPNVRLNTDSSPFLQNEEQIWINLTDSLSVVADWRDWRLGFRRVGVGVSTDGGATWFDQLLSPLVFDRQSDPCIVGDATGRFFINVLDYDSQTPTGGGNSLIVVYTSTNGGLSWNGPTPIQPLGPYFEDKQFTAVDRTGGPHDGNYYVSWTRFPNPDRMIFVRSTDGGVTFDDTVTVGPVIPTACGIRDQGQFSIPIVNSDGSVHVFWQGAEWDSADCSGVRAIRRARSNDGGVTFTQDSVAFFSTLGYWDVDGSIDVYGMPNGDADISGGPYDGTIYIARTEFSDLGTLETDVVLHRSTDNGLTWDDTVTINDDPVGQNIDQFHPWLIVNEDGTILVVFYDQREDPISHFLFDCYFSASYDGGETFITNYRLSSVSSSPGNLASVRSKGIARNELDPYPGAVSPTATLSPMAGAIAEYIGVHAKHDYAVAVWTDTRDGTQDVYSTRFDIPFLKPRLYLPADGFATPTSAAPAFRWSTCWHEAQDSYRLEIASDPGFVAIEYTESGITDNNHAPAVTLTAGIHYWRVKAFRTLGDSTEYSDVLQFETGCQTPAAPQLVSPLDGGTVDTPTVQLDWSPVPGAAEYQFQFSELPDYSILLWDATTSGTFHWVENLVNESTYYWRVNATNDCDTGPWTEASFTLACTQATVPVGLSPAVVDTVTDSSTEFSWDFIPDAESYRLQVSTEPDFSSFFYDDDVISPQITLGGLTDMTDYYWRVNSTNFCETGDWATSSFSVFLCPVAITGDVNVDGVITSADIIYLVNYVFKSAAPPLPVEEAGDVNCDAQVTSADIIYLVNFVFKSDQPPCDVCTIFSP